MGLFEKRCPYCGELDTDPNLDWSDIQDGKHPCKIETLRTIIDEQGRRGQEYFNRLNTIHNAVQMLVKEVGSLDQEEVTVKTEWFKKLWEASQIEFHVERIRDIDSFLKEYSGLLGISLRASRLFVNYPTSMERRLNELREACIKHKQSSYPTDPPLDVTVEQIRLQLI